jgi:uncharacterized membrane protein
VDAVRGVSAIHGRRGIGAATGRQAPPLAGERGGKVKEWDAEITEQRPHERVAWTSRSGTRNAGVVTFHRLDDHRTKLMLQVDYEPEGAVENVADAIGVVSGRVVGDLNRFKEFIETRHQETGAWRGEITQGQVKQTRRASP